MIENLVISVKTHGPYICLYIYTYGLRLQVIQF